MFNTDNLKQIRQDLNEALSAVKEKYNVDINLGGISYSENEFTTKLTVSNKDKSYKQYTGMVAIGKTFVKDNKPFVVEDIVTKNRKYPYIIKNTDTGTSYKVSMEYFSKVVFTN